MLSNVDVFDRDDFLITRWALLGLAVLAPLLLLGRPLLAWILGDPLSWTGDTGASADLSGVVGAGDTAQVRWAGLADVRLDDARAGLWLLTLVPAALLSGAVCAVALLLHRLVGAIEAGTPFTPAGLTALRAVGIVIAAAAVVVPMAEGTANAFVMSEAVPDAVVGIGWTFDLPWMLAGLVVLALAEAFRVGTRLADDVEGLV
jgi:hypothetical protein